MMKKLKREKLGDLVANKCEVLELYKNKVIVKVADKESLIAKKIGNIKKGDKVNIFKKNLLSRTEEFFIYVSPVYYMILGFIFGFLLSNDLFHYLLILGATVLGFVQLFILKHFLIEKASSTIYVAVKN